MARLSDLYELHVHGNTYHAENYITATYVENIIRNIMWQDAVISMYDPSGGTPASPSYGDRYISSATANGWTENYIEVWDGETWDEIIPETGYITFDKNQGIYTAFDGTDWVVLESLFQHNNIDGLQGGNTTERYHLKQSAYDNLKNQDQPVRTTDVVTFDDFSITNPTSAYLTLNHDDFNDYVIEEHRQWEYSITQNIHDDNITSYNVTQHEGDIVHNNVDGLQGGTTLKRYHLPQIAYNNLYQQDQEVLSTSDVTFSTITLATTASEPDHVVRKDYIDSLFQEGMRWQPSVISFWDASTSLPASADTADRYIASSTGNGWTENYIYEYQNGSWIEIIPEDWYAALVENEERLYAYKSDIDEWLKMATLYQHNNLSGINGSSQGYHLSQSAYNNLYQQDQTVKTDSSVIFDDISISNPIDIYNLSHDSFADFLVDEHIDWTITGSKTIHDDRVTSSNVTQHETDIDHDVLTNFVSNEHINHSGVDITAGEGLSGGGDLTTSFSINLDIDSLSTKTEVTSGDYLCFYDVETFTHNKIPISEFGAGGGLQWQAISEDTIAVDGQGYLVDTSVQPITIRLPSNPEEGFQVGVCDYTGNANTNNITVDGNGYNVVGNDETFLIDIDDAGISLAFVNNTVGWELVSEVPIYGSKIGDEDAEVPTNEIIEARNWDMNDGTYLSIDQVKARDIDGLLVTDNTNNGLFVEDGGGLYTTDGFDILDSSTLAISGGSIPEVDRANTFTSYQTINDSLVLNRAATHIKIYETDSPTDSNDSFILEENNDVFNIRENDISTSTNYYPFKINQQVSDDTLVLTQSGVGINTNNPGSSLDVVGTVESEKLKIDDSSHAEKFEIVYNSSSNSLDFNFIG